MTTTARLKNWLVALDQFVLSTVTLGAAYPDETISAAAWRTEQQGKIIGKVLRPCIDFVFSLFEKNHCQQSYLSEINRTQLPKAYRNTDRCKDD